MESWCYFCGGFGRRGYGHWGFCPTLGRGRGCWKGVGCVGRGRESIGGVVNGREGIGKGRGC